MVLEENFGISIRTPVLWNSQRLFQPVVVVFISLETEDNILRLPAIFAESCFSPYLVRIPVKITCTLTQTSILTDVNASNFSSPFVDLKKTSQSSRKMWEQRCQGTPSDTAIAKPKSRWGGKTPLSKVVSAPVVSGIQQSKIAENPVKLTPEEERRQQIEDEAERKIQEAFKKL